jgi:hypothetical protein
MAIDQEGRVHATPQPIFRDARGNIVNPYGESLGSIAKKGAIFAGTALGGQALANAAFSPAALSDPLAWDPMYGAAGSPSFYPGLGAAAGGAASAATGGAGADQGISKLHTALALLAGAGPGLFARLTGGGSGSGSVPPELRDMLALAQQRTQYQNPLFEAATRQAFGGLPQYATTGLTLGSLPK